MPSVNLRVRSLSSDDYSNTSQNDLPTILQTPSGLAILEIQGTIHAPYPPTDDEHNARVIQTPIGRIEFPLFDPQSDPNDLKWMKRVFLYVGKHQRLTGEVKKLPKPLLVVSKKAKATPHPQDLSENVEDLPSEELEILEVIRHKILFGGRPEPVGD